MTKPQRQAPERKIGFLKASPEPLHIGGATSDVEVAAETKPKKAKKKPVTTQLSLDPLLEARAIVNATYGRPGGYGSFNAFMDAALVAEVERARKKFNDGEPFEYNEDDDAGLRKGRPLGS